MRSVLLIISVPDRTNSSASGCNSHGPIVHAPQYRLSPSRPCHAANASTPVSTTLVGIGVPSKYLTLPLSLPSDELFGGDVEARETADAAADEVGERDPVPAAVEPGRKGERRGRDAERNDVGERIELPAERRMRLPPARDPAVEDVEDEGRAGRAPRR